MAPELELRRRKSYARLKGIRGMTFACRRLFAKSGYSVALIARGAEVVDKLTEEINKSGGHVRSADLL